MKILIADDDAGDRKQIKRAINQAGAEYECWETESTEKALDLCGQFDFDCVIVDYHLPGQNGLAGISAIHEQFPNTSIVMSTGQGDELVAAEAIKRGASDYIPKSAINVASIRRIIDSAIEKNALQRKVRQQQEELGNFARVLAHDLRAPGAAIQTLATRISERLASGEPDKALEYADWVIQTAERMNRLIETLHQYTTADVKVTFEPVDMNRIFEAAVDNLRDLIQESGSEVTSARLPMVLGNAPQLIQLLQNLMGNGIKFCDNPVPRIHLEASEGQDGALLFAMTDNGIGIPEAQSKRVFEPFIRLTGTAKRKGSGLGLATCKKVIERHRGSIWCQSKPGLGTTFFFVLSAAPPQAEQNDQSSLSIDTVVQLTPDIPSKQISNSQ